jgi:hypothetical protein
MPIEVFIGVDVCKPRLDLMILPTGEVLELTTGQKWNHIVQHELPRPTRQQDLSQAIQPHPKHRPFRRPMILELQPLQT